MGRVGSDAHARPRMTKATVPVSACTISWCVSQNGGSTGVDGGEGGGADGEADGGGNGDGGGGGGGGAEGGEGRRSSSR